MLNTQSPIPLYQQLVEILTDQIHSGKYKAGKTIPPEISLSKLYGIGRPTVRQAMDVLVQRGLIERKRGSGTFVKQKQTPVDLFSLAGTSAAFSTKGIGITSQIIEPIRAQKISDDEKNPFNGKEAYQLSRLTFAEKNPILLEDIYLEKELFLGIDKMDIKGQSLARIVADKFFLKPDHAVQRFKIAFLFEKWASLLNLSSEDPVLEVRRELNFPSAPKAVYAILYCRTDQFDFSQTIADNTK
ncbi:MAG: GntR family transcriptional regulator [Desulfobacteraceae bacterium]|nr:GntR family transcriptional regulator [Desulfobacteraceae bacterium]